MHNKAGRQAAQVPRAAIRRHFGYARFVADHGQFGEAEPERKRHVHVRR
jgi:hypothetical protein